jgi:hypothetical protein
LRFKPCSFPGPPPQLVGQLRQICASLCRCNQPSNLPIQRSDLSLKILGDRCGRGRVLMVLQGFGEVSEPIHGST